MFRIGDFSRLAHVSTRLLRHYDQLGLLKPAEVDTQTGYRLYRASQLAQLNRILVLRDLGFSLDQIGGLLAESLDPEQLRAMLLLRRAEVEREVAVQSARLQELERRISDLELPEEGAADDVLIRSLPSHDYLSARVKLTGLEAARELLARIQAELPGQLRRGRRRLGRVLIIQHAQHYEPDALELELGYEVDQGAEATLTAELAEHRFTLRRLPAVAAAAVCVRTGPPQSVHASAQAIALAVEARGYRLAGPNRELFLRLPTARDLPVVEMQFPVHRPGA